MSYDLDFRVIQNHFWGCSLHHPASFSIVLRPKLHDAILFQHVIDIAPLLLFLCIWLIVLVEANDTNTIHTTRCCCPCQTLHGQAGVVTATVLISLGVLF